MSADTAALERFVLEKMRQSRTPGVSISIVTEGATRYARALGFRDVSSGLAATPRTLYGIGSVTKSFTALAIMQLVEKGALSLDDKVDEYIPGVPRPFGVSPTIHDLLTHSSGFPALGYAEAFMNGVLGIDSSWLPVSTAEDVITFMSDASDWAVSKPGRRFFYLNEGYVLLGNIIAQLSDTTYETFVQKMILRPLGMSRTFVARADVEKDGDRATPYIVDKEGKHIASQVPYGINADGGIISNVLDLSNYLRMCLNRGQFNTKTILSKKLFDAMAQPHVPMPYEYFGEEAYGYGWTVSSDFYGHKLIDHSGSVGVYTAYVGYIPEKNVGVAVLGNPSKYPASNIGTYALAQLLGEDPNTLPFIREDRLFDKLQGDYETYKGTVKIGIKRKGDFLFMEMKDRYTEEILPLIPERLEEDRAIFYTLSEGLKLKTEFNVRKEKVELIFEGYKALRKHPA